MRCFKVQTKFPQANRWIPIFGQIRAQLSIQQKMTVKAAILWTRGFTRKCPPKPFGMAIECREQGIQL